MNIVLNSSNQEERQKKNPKDRRKLLRNKKKHKAKLKKQDLSEDGKESIEKTIADIDIELLT